jgi:ubiquinol-cytochrome c reductase cytochrome b subunit
MGPRLFARHCASCHSHVDAEGNGIPVEEESTAPNLYGIGTPGWFQRLLDPKQFASDDMFGRTSHKDGDMYYAIDDRFSELDEEKRLARDDLIAALSAEAQLVSRRTADAKAREDGVIAKGKELLVDTFTCTECHKFYANDPMYGAPDLTGIYSTEWLREFIADPSHARFYGDNNDRMPAFGRDDLLTDHEIDMLVRWLRGDDRDLALKFAPLPATEEKPKPADSGDKTQPRNGDKDSDGGDSNES